MGNFKSKKPRTGFNRPLATGGQVDRSWQDVYPEHITVDDILAGIGIIISIVWAEDNTSVLAGIPDSKEYYLPNDIKVKAFTRKAD
jgi:hypothetical protein